jgi:hypothetical protein
MGIQRLFIIGNGFDLSLGLPTSYTDFINSSFFKDEEKKGTLLFKKLREKHDIQNWIDVETELARLSPNFRTEELIDQFRDGHKNLCDALCQYIQSIDTSNINKNSHAYAEIKNNFNQTDSYIINFNYTDTAQKILAEMSISNPGDYIHHIHGSCLHKDIIFGISDGAASISSDHNFLYKSYKGKDGGRILIDHMRLGHIKEFRFFGHSLGEQDYMYFKLLGALSYRSFSFSYFGRDGYQELDKRLRKLTNGNIQAFRANNQKIDTFDTSNSKIPE